MGECIPDHSVISFKISTQRPGHKERVIICTRTKNIDRQKLFIGYSEKKVPSILDCAGDKIDACNDIMTELLDKPAPLRIRIMTCRPSAPWLTAEVKQAKVERK